MIQFKYKKTTEETYASQVKSSSKNVFTIIRP